MPTAVSLRTVIEASRRLDELGTARWIEAAADAVHKAQSQGQPLGKLTPDSLVMREGQVVLELPSSPSTAYRAPEVLRGGSGDRRSDVWSLGVMLWEALAHVRLFEGVNDSAIRAAVENGEITPVNEMNANVPAELGAICTKALQRDPTNRYQSAKVMAAEISAVLDDAGYPEGTEAITRWIVKEFPAGAAPAPVPVPAPAIASAPASKPHSQTVMGIKPLVVAPAAPVVAAAPKSAPAKPPVDNKTEPLTSVDIIEHRPMTPLAEVIALDNPVIPLSVKKPAPNDTLQDARPAFLGQKPGALTQGWDIPEEPKPEPARPKSDSKAPPSSLPSWAQRPTGNTQPPPIATAPIAPAPIAAAPIAVAPAPVATPIAPAPAPIAAVAPAPIAATPIAPAPISTAPAPIATAAAFNPSSTLPGVTSNPSIVPPNLKLPDAPPGATVTADKPPAFATTSLVGSSLSTAVPGVTPAPAKFDGARTAMMGSNSIIEATNAAVSAANPPVLVPNPPILPGAKPAPVAPPVVAPPVVAPSPAATVLPVAATGTPAIKISEAVTVGTPAVAPLEVEARITIPRTPTPVPNIRAVNWDTEGGKKAAPATAEAVAKLPPPAADDFTEKESSSASAVVSLPRARGDKTGKGDVLQGWGWGTDSHTAIGALGDDDGDASYEEDRKKHKKRMMIVFGGVGAAALLVVGLAFAFSGGEKKEAEPVAKTTAPIGDPTQAGGGQPVADPPKPDPQPGSAEPPKPDPLAGSAEPPKPDPEPAKPDPEPAKPDPVKVEPKKPDVAKVEPKKPEPVAIKVEPKKPEPPKKPDPVKIQPKKPDPVKVEPKKPDPVAVKVDPKKPEDPYKPKVDAAAAYKTGFQQYVKGDANGALATFKEALSSNPGYAPTWRGIGLVYEKLGRKSQAATAFKKYLELSPNAGDAEQIRSRLEKL